MKKILLTFIFIIISTNLLAFEKDTNFTIEDFKAGVTIFLPSGESVQRMMG